MGKKKKTPEKQLMELRNEIVKDFERWKYIAQNGCNDPSWPDGMNMNLARSHIKYEKNQIEILCKELNTEFPKEYYLPIPPKVDVGYMNNFNDEKRVDRLNCFGEKLVHYDIEGLEDILNISTEALL